MPVEPAQGPSRALPGNPHIDETKQAPCEAIPSQWHDSLARYARLRATIGQLEEGGHDYSAELIALTTDINEQRAIAEANLQRAEAAITGLSEAGNQLFEWATDLVSLIAQIFDLWQSARRDYPYGEPMRQFFWHPV